MTLPTINDVQPIDPILTNLLIGYQQADARFVATKVFPSVTVDKDNGTYMIFDKKYWFADEMKPRAPGQVYPRCEFGASTGTYKTLQWALAKSIADETRANSQIPMDLEQATLKWLAQQNMIRLERSWAADFMTTSVWQGATDDTTSTDWDDFSAGDPVANVLATKRAISVKTGYDPNTLVVGFIVWEALVNNPDLMDRVKNTQAATIQNMNGALASIFDLGQILVGKASYNSANEYTTMTGAAILDDDALVCYVSPNPGIFEASAGYTFTWAPGGGIGSIMPKFRDEANDADLIKFKAQWDQAAVATDVGAFYSDIV